MKSKLLDRPFFHLALIAFWGLLAYSNTFDVPFQWDEKSFIIENPILKDLGYFFDASKAKEFDRYNVLNTRFAGYLTFAMNYQIHGTDVRGYHVFNLSVHLLNAMLVYLLVMLSFKTPFLKGSALREKAGSIALLSGLLFVAHPVQTEAVTYIFQRLASLAALFYLLSLVSYIGSRLSEGKKRRYALYALSLLSAALAMKTKENAFTLPVAIALYEFFFFGGEVKTRILRLAPLLLTMLIVPLTIAGADRPAGEIISGMALVPRGYEGFTRTEYLLTQFSVIVTYLRLLLLPVNQNIDYDYPVYGSFSMPHVALSAALLLFVFGLGVLLAFRSRKRNPAHRLIAFGIFWFFITLSVESSVIPIPMLIDEYRLYLPSAGVFVAMLSGMFLLYERLGRGKLRTALAVFVCLVPLVLASATHSRNKVWRSEISLWEDVVSKAPQNIWAHINLGTRYREAGITDKAIEQYNIALRLNPYFEVPYNNLGNLYLSEQSYQKAMSYFEAALSVKPDYPDANYNLGVVYEQTGQPEEAVRYYKKTIELNPYHVNAHYNLGVVYHKAGQLEEAIGYYKKTLELNPNYIDAHYNLGLAYLKIGSTAMAREEFERALEIDPGYINAREQLDILKIPLK